MIKILRIILDILEILLDDHEKRIGMPLVKRTQLKIKRKELKDEVEKLERGGGNEPANPNPIG